MSQATAAGEHPERIDALERRGSLIGSEHLGRYLWASRLAPDTLALDAGCGTGYGTAMLLDAGAARVVGVDISEQAIAQAAERCADERVELRQADLRELPFAEDTFDLVACFEVIEHVHDPEAVLDELARVLKRDGTLCISTPQRGVYPPDNEHHLREFTQPEFEEALSARFRHVAPYRQSAWLGSAIEGTDQAEASWSAPELLPTYRITSVPVDDSSRAPFLLATASDRALAPMQPLTVLGDPFEVTWWEGQVQNAGSEARRAEAHARGQAAAAERRLAEAQSRNADIAAQLLEVERDVALSHARAFTLQEELEARQELIEELRAEVRERDATLERERQKVVDLNQAEERLSREEEGKLRAERVITRMKESVSWKVTAPLRAAKRLAGR